VTNVEELSLQQSQIPVTKVVIQVHIKIPMETVKLAQLDVDNVTLQDTAKLARMDLCSKEPPALVNLLFKLTKIIEIKIDINF